MSSVGTCFNFVSQVQFYKALVFGMIVLKSIIILHLGICLKIDRGPEASGLSTNYRTGPCNFYDLDYYPINGSLDLYYFN